MAVDLTFWQGRLTWSVFGQLVSLARAASLNDSLI
jgi:hypothetical protein